MDRRGFSLMAAACALAWFVACGKAPAPPSNQPPVAKTGHPEGPSAPGKGEPEKPAPPDRRPEGRLRVNPVAVTFLPGFLGVQLTALEHKADVTKKVTWTIEPQGVA